MGVEYLAASVAHDSVDVRVFDADVHGRQAACSELASFQPEVIGITNMSFQADVANTIAEDARSICPYSLIVKGGAHETAGGWRYSLGYHGDYVDVCVLGEGEHAFRELIAWRARGEPKRELNSIRNIAFNTVDGPVSTAPDAHTGDFHVLGRIAGGAATNSTAVARPDINQLIPWRNDHHPSYDFGVLGNRKTAQVMTVRGCAERCFFCSEAVGPAGVRSRDEASLRAEFESLCKKGYEAVYFDDPTFTDNAAHMAMLCRLMKEYRFVWGCNTRVDALTAVMAEQMAASNCAYIFCGVESLCPGVLLGLNKTRDPEGYIAAAKCTYQLLGRVHIPKSVFLIFGGPRLRRTDRGVVYGVETLDDIHLTIRTALYELHPDFLSMNALRFIPNVPLSFAPRFAYLRPGSQEIHAGYYDSGWLEATKMPDVRSTHAVFSAYEGRFSVNPDHMTPQHCYDILALAVEQINEYVHASGRCVELVVRDTFRSRYLSRNAGKYRLATFSEMGDTE